MSSIDKDKFCYMPWTSLALLPDGRITTCCAALGDGHELGHLQRGDTFSRVWMGAKLASIREQFLSGQWPVSCLGCQVRQAHGLTSHKDHFTDLLVRHNLLHTIDLQAKAPQVLHLDLAFSNHCNLACRMCSSQYSSKWVAVERYLQEQGFPAGSRTSEGPVESQLSELAEIFPRLKELQFLIIKGGEPLIGKNFEPVLEMAIAQGLAKNIELHIVTNGTIAPSDNLLNLLGRFKRVVLVVSVDGTGRLFQYIRGGQKFPLSVVENSLRRFQTLSNVAVSAYPTIQAYNIFDLSRLAQWAQTMKVSVSFRHFLNSPSYLKITVLPKELQLSAKAELERFLSQLDGSDNLYAEIASVIERLGKETRQDLFPQFVQFTKLLDQYHQISIEEAAPELRGLLSWGAGSQPVTSPS